MRLRGGGGGRASRRATKDERQRWRPAAEAGDATREGRGACAAEPGSLSRDARCVAHSATRGPRRGARDTGVVWEPCPWSSEVLLPRQDGRAV